MSKVFLGNIASHRELKMLKYIYEGKGALDREAILYHFSLNQGWQDPHIITTLHDLQALGLVTFNKSEGVYTTIENESVVRVAITQTEALLFNVPQSTVTEIPDPPSSAQPSDK